MSSGLLMVLATAVTAVLLVVLLVVVLRSARSRQRLEQQLAASRDDLAELQLRLERLGLGCTRKAHAACPPTAPAMAGSRSVPTCARIRASA